MKPLKVLIVDDEPLLRLDFESLVEEMGHEVITAANGHQAAAFYRDNPCIDAIICDIRMMHGDGLFMLQYLKRLREPKPATLMHSSAGTYQPPEGSEEYDLAQHIPKYFDFASFHLKRPGRYEYIKDFLDQVAKESVN